MVDQNKRPVWFGAYSVNANCEHCGNRHTARQRKSDGVWRLPAHKRYVSIRGSLSHAVQCENPTVSEANLRDEYRSALRRDLLHREKSGLGTYAGWRARVIREALASEYNDTPGLRDLDVLFELFRDVLAFLLSDTLWRHVAVQEAASAPLLRSDDNIPVLRWDGNEARLLDRWTLLVGEREGGGWWWSAYLREAGGLSGASDSPWQARLDAQDALRSSGVAFRVEKDGQST